MRLIRVLVIKYGYNFETFQVFYLDSATYHQVIQFYSHDSFTVIHEKLKSKYMYNGYILIGDMNARFGKSVREILPFVEVPGVDLYT